MPPVVVREERVALPAFGEADDVDRHERLERGGGVGADEAQLAHVRDVEQHRRLAALAVLGEDACGVGDRHVVAGERHHLRAERQVQGMERRFGTTPWRGKGRTSDSPEQVLSPPEPEDAGGKTAPAVRFT